MKQKKMYERPLMQAVKIHRETLLLLTSGLQTTVTRNGYGIAIEDEWN